MTIAKPNLFSLPSPSAVIDAVRSYFHTEDAPVAAPRAVQPEIETDSVDQARYERLLEHELDRQHLTDVEREDTEMLNRVRDALYADD